MRGLRQADRHSQPASQPGRQYSPNCKSYFLFHLLPNCPELAPVAPGLVLQGVPREPGLQPPPGGEPCCPGAVDSGGEQRYPRARRGSRRATAAAKNFPGREDRRQLAQSPGANFCKPFLRLRLFSAAVKTRRRRTATRKKKDVRSASLAPVAELGRARAAAAGRPLPLAAEEGTSRRSPGGRDPPLVGLCGSALIRAAGRAAALGSEFARGLQGTATSEERSVSDRDFSKPGSARASRQVRVREAS